MLNQISNVVSASRPLKRLARCLSVVVLGALLAFRAVSAQAQNGTFHFSGAFFTVIYDTCTGEYVDINVEFKSDFHLSFDSAGGILLDAHDVYSGRGVGEVSGTVYNVDQTDSFNLTAKVGEQVSEGLHFSMISRGGTPNLESRFLIHITFNPDGTITAFTDDFEVTCQ